MADHTPENQQALGEIVRTPCIAVKGQEKGRKQQKEGTVASRKARQNHPGVESAIGAMQSGIYYGYVGLVEGIAARIKKEYGKSMKVIATGGLVSGFAGVVSTDGAPPDENLLKRMAERLAFRGPDGTRISTGRGL